MIETYYHISATHHYSTVYSDEKEAYYSLLMGIIVSQRIQNGTQSRLPNISDRSQFQNSYLFESWFDCLKITIIILLPPTMHSSSSNHPISTPSTNSNPLIDHNDTLKEHLLIQSHKDYKCICQTCTCGKHRCPKPHVKGDFQTNYNNHYRPIHQKVNVQPPAKYQYKQRHYRPEALMTRYQQTFIKKQPYLNEDLNKSRLENVGKTIVRPHVPFDTTTSYTDQYRPYSLQHPNNPEDLYINSRDKIPDYGFQSPAKFDDHTAYRQYFAAPSPPKLQKSPYPQYKKPEVVFSGDSRYKEDYKQYKIVQPKYESYSQSLSQVPKVKFEDRTAYKDHYKSFEVKQQPMYSGKGCVLQKMELPKTNFLNSSAHVYIDPTKARLCE